MNTGVKKFTIFLMVFIFLFGIGFSLVPISIYTGLENAFSANKHKSIMLITTSMFGSTHSVHVTTSTIDFTTIEKCYQAQGKISGQHYQQIPQASIGVSDVLTTAVCFEK